jgi:cytochrome P450
MSNAPAANDMFPPEMRTDPYPIYRQLRENAPVFDTGQDLWVVTSFEHCHSLLRDPRSSKNLRNMDDYERKMEETGRMAPMRALLEQLMSFNDPPEHTRIRGRFQRAFGPRLVQRLRDRATETAANLLDDLGGAGEIDLVADFAWQFPLVVVAEMLGVPATDRQRFHAWSRDLAPSFELAMSPEEAERAQRAADEFIEYFHQVIEARSREPENDLVSGLVNAEDDADVLSQEQLVVNLILILAAGHETVMNLIGNAMLALLRHPDQLELLRSRPELMEDAVEELLRYDCPIQLTTRIAIEDITLDGQTIPAGARIAIALASANRDSERFPDADRLDLTRGDRNHLALGGGVHYCLGNALARIEAGIAIGMLLDRYERIELATEQLEYRDTILVRGVKALPLRVTPAQA